MSSLRSWHLRLIHVLLIPIWLPIVLVTLAFLGVVLLLGVVAFLYWIVAASIVYVQTGKWCSFEEVFGT